MNFNISLPGLEEFIITKSFEGDELYQLHMELKENLTPAQSVTLSQIEYMIIECKKFNTFRLSVEIRLYFIESDVILV